MKKKSFIMILALVLVFGIAIGGTIAWLQDTTDPVTNTFTVGKIDIELEESDDLDLKIIPGKTITKDPVVTVKAESEACWLFVKIEEKNWSDKLTYAIADGWTALTGNDGVYYREVDAVTADTEYKVLADDEVLCANTLTTDEMKAMDTAKPELKFTAYAVQKENVADAATAWAYANP